MRTLAILFVAATMLAGCVVVPHHDGRRGHHYRGHEFSQSGPSHHYHSGPRHGSGHRHHRR